MLMNLNCAVTYLFHLAVFTLASVISVKQVQKYRQRRFTRRGKKLLTVSKKTNLYKKGIRCQINLKNTLKYLLDLLHDCIQTTLHHMHHTQHTQLFMVVIYHSDDI